MLNELLNPNWKPTYRKWRHGGWYVTNLVYPSGAVGCVAPIKGGYIIACGDSTVYRNRKEAVEAERQAVINLWKEVTL